MIVTEYAGHTQGFLVEGVDTILRLDWSQMRVPPACCWPRWAVW
jgi:two-component system chemotaxis response regulator CheV